MDREIVSNFKKLLSDQVRNGQQDAIEVRNYPDKKWIIIEQPNNETKVSTKFTKVVPKKEDKKKEVPYITGLYIIDKSPTNSYEPVVNTNNLSFSSTLPFITTKPILTYNDKGEDPANRVLDYHKELIDRHNTTVINIYNYILYLCNELGLNITTETLEENTSNQYLFEYSLPGDPVYGSYYWNGNLDSDGLGSPFEWIPSTSRGAGVIGWRPGFSLNPSSTVHKIILNNKVICRSEVISNINKTSVYSGYNQFMQFVTPSDQESLYYAPPDYGSTYETDYTGINPIYNRSFVARVLNTNFFVEIPVFIAEQYFTIQASAEVGKDGFLYVYIRYEQPQKLLHAPYDNAQYLDIFSTKTIAKKPIFTHYLKYELGNTTPIYHKIIKGTHLVSDEFFPLSFSGSIMLDFIDPGYLLRTPSQERTINDLINSYHPYKELGRTSDHTLETFRSIHCYLGGKYYQLDNPTTILYNDENETTRLDYINNGLRTEENNKSRKDRWDVLDQSIVKLSISKIDVNEVANKALNRMKQIYSDLSSFTDLVQATFYMNSNNFYTSSILADIKNFLLPIPWQNTLYTKGTYLNFLLWLHDFSNLNALDKYIALLHNKYTLYPSKTVIQRNRYFLYNHLGSSYTSWYLDNTTKLLLTPQIPLNLVYFLKSFQESIIKVEFQTSTECVNYFSENNPILYSLTLRVNAT